MNNRIRNNCAKFLILLLMLLVVSGVGILEADVANATSNTPSEEALNINNLVYAISQKNINNIYTLYGFDEKDLYVFVELENEGYMIFYKNTMELLEYAKEGNPICDYLTQRIYYDGPMNYYVAEENRFINVLNGTIISKSDMNIDEYRTKYVATFEDQLSNNIVDETSYYVQSPDIDKDSLITDYYNEVYISNSKYFAPSLTHPQYGENIHGTCSSVATQLLLSYNNFYVDRRIIANEDLNGTGNQNPNTCTDPSRISSSLLGTPDSYYRKIISAIEPGGLPDNCTHTTDEDGNIVHSHDGATLWEVEDGIESLLNGRGVEYDIRKITLLTPISTSYATNEIDEDRPLIVSMDSNLGGVDHAVVAYGYANYTYPNTNASHFGYIVHTGWKSLGFDASGVWINSDWCDGYLALEINHTHSFVFEGGEFGEEQCSICGCRRSAFIFEYNDSTSIIIGTTRNFTGEINVPERLNGKTVVGIGNGAFANQTGITSITIPRTVTSIGHNTFENCTSLTTVTFDEDLENEQYSQLQTIGNSAFAGSSALTAFNIPSTVTSVGANAFLDCVNLEDVVIEDDSCMTTLGNAAFYGCSKLGAVNIPSGLTSIGPNTFQGCGEMMSLDLVGTAVTSIGNSAFESCARLILVNIGENVASIGQRAFYGCGGLGAVYCGETTTLTSIGASAFEECRLMLNFTLSPTISSIGDNAFKNCEDLKSINLPNSMAYIGPNAFSGCSSLTVYTAKMSAPGAWSTSWNPLGRPVLWGCTLATDNQYVVSFTKGAGNPATYNGINNPYRRYQEFEGWYTTADFTGTMYETIESAPNGALYAKYAEDACVAQGTMITLANGTQVAVEDLTGNEQLLVWNMLTGTFDSAPIVFVDSDELASYRVIKLTFDDNTTLEIIGEHALWDFDLNRYVYLDDGAAAYVGHEFNKQIVDEDGNMTYTRVELVDVDIFVKTTRAYSPVTYGHLCYYVNGLLSMPGGIDGLFNIFEVDSSTMAYDTQEMAQDIATYGLFSYEEFSEHVEINSLVFDAFNGQYLKVAMGKGLIDWQDIERLLNRYATLLP